MPTSLSSTIYVNLLFPAFNRKVLEILLLAYWIDGSHAWYYVKFAYPSRANIRWNFNYLTGIIKNVDITGIYGAIF